jgi:Zn-dependent protease with chaperone function
MNADKFLAASQKATKTLSFAFIPIFVLWFVVFLIVLLPPYKSESFSVFGAVVSLMAAGCLFVLFWLVSRALARKHELVCPRCGYRFKDGALPKVQARDVWRCQ